MLGARKKTICRSSGQLPIFGTLREPGYTDRMTAFLESNPGLKSRFNKFIHFGDYTAAEMPQIFAYMLKKAQYRATEEARMAIERAMCGRQIHGE
jgi:hypothetical protein